MLHLSAGNLFGGIETLLTTLARLRHLSPGMEPEFGLCFRGRSWEELAATGAGVHDLGPVRLSRPWTVRRSRERLGEVLAKSRHDVVVAHGPWSHAAFAPAVRRAGVRLVQFAHGEMTGRHWMERWLALTPPDLVIANSRFTAGSAGELLRSTPASVIYPPVPPPEIPEPGPTRRRVRAEWDAPDGAVVVLMVSRLESLKGHAVLLDALGRLRGRREWACWIAGGPQRPSEVGLLAELRRLAGRLGLADRVRFLGRSGRVADLMLAADIYCQPNTGPEGFGLTFVEALLAGLPVVTSGIGGGAEIVDRTCGLLTRPGDATDVAGAIRELIEDPAMRRELGAGGPRRAGLLCDPARQLGAAAAALRPGAEAVA